MSLRILHAVEKYAPSVGGAQAVVRQISERLAQRGHEVTVATAANPEREGPSLRGVRIEEFPISGNAVRGMTGPIDEYREFVRDGGFDVVMLYAAQQWATDALLPCLHELNPAPVLAPCGFSALQDPGYAAYFEGLAASLPSFRAVIVHSSDYQDALFVREAGVAPTVIPNAADEGEFAQPPVTGAFRGRFGVGAQAPLLLTVGGHTGLKGHPQAMAVLRRARTARGGTLALLGNEPYRPSCLRRCRVQAAYTGLTARGRRVLLEDPPRDQVVEAYWDADLFVFCSMVECSPLVLFEAMAAGLPFVSLDVGNAAEIAGWSGAGVIVESARRSDGLVVADTGAVVAAVDGLLADAERRREMGERGRRAWQERFTWEHVTGQYEELYESVVAA